MFAGRPDHKNRCQQLRSQLSPRYSIATLLLLTATIASIIGYIRKSAELTKTRIELQKLQQEMLTLDADDNSRIYAMGFPTHGPLHWRWKVQLPVKGEFQLRYAIDQFPISGLPKASFAIDEAFLDSYRKPLPGGVPFTLDVSIYENGHGNWVVTSQNGSCGWGHRISDPPSWLNGPMQVGWLTNHSPGKTVFAEADSALLLLHHHKENGSLHIWIEEVTSQAKGAFNNNP